MARAAFTSCLLMALISLVLPPALAHETDQYAIPAGREMPDLGDYFSRWVYNAIDRGVQSTNARIRSAVDSGERGDSLKRLQTDEAVAHAVNREFPYAIWLIQDLDSKMASPEMKLRFPGGLPGFKPLPTFKQVAAFPLNPVRAWGSSSMMVYGVQIGADKIGHFTDMGMHYYQTYKGYLAKGDPEPEAFRKAIAVGMDDPLKGESKLLGEWTSGDYSNGDLAVNYIGFVFYRNLTEPQMLKGAMRPPMLVRDGNYWKIAPHVQPGNDFFSIFISNHIDEALNPGRYVTGMRAVMREHIAQSIEGTLEHRLDRWGNRRSQAWFAKESRDLRTYYGIDYGARGTDAELLSISDVCFPYPKDANSRDSIGRTPLHRAVAFADIGKVNELLRGGADVNEAVRSNESYNSNWGDTPLHLAVQDGREEIVKLLIARGADVNRANDRGATPLHRAVEYPGLMTLLLDAGAKVDAQDVQGRSPLHWAAMGATADAIDVLIFRSANENLRDAQGQTPLHYAARYANAENIKLLIENGADVNAADQFGATPLHVAAASRQAVAVAALLSGNASANATDKFGATPLHDASRRGAVEIASALVHAGAKASAADLFGFTPLHLACRNGYEAVAMRLMQAGASPAIAAGGARVTPIDEARNAGFANLANNLASMAQMAAYQR